MTRWTLILTIIFLLLGHISNGQTNSFQITIGQTTCIGEYHIEASSDSASALCIFDLIMPKCIFDYPTLASQNKTEGKVFISFDITDKCEIINIKLVKGLDGDLDKIAMNFVTELGKDIKKHHTKCCSTLLGQPYILPIVFKIKNK